ncbi:MAG: FGGY family pentulose kinase [Roseiarcus sp.]|uniref:FGGY family pentulose kinase n=1 Tax=Roseiarcus sp. TaxID=1969460 RepID=UPI003C1995EF
MDEALIGVDVGTGSVRAGVFTLRGQLLSNARRVIATWREAGDIVEQSSADIWAATVAAVRAAIEAAGVKPESVGGIGFDATCSLVVLDPSGQSLPVGPSGDPARDVIVWMDHRAVEEAELINRGGHDALRYVGGAISPEMQPPKLLWLARHAPRVFASAGHFFDLADFLTFRATGSLARSACTVACKWLYLARERRWPQDFFAGVGLGALGGPGFARIGAEIVAPGTALGRGLAADAANAFGLPPGVPVGAGLIDAHAGALATLAAARGDEIADPRRRIALVLGTSACCMAVADEARFIPGVWGPHYAALTPGQWLDEGGQSAFGAAIDRLMRMSPAFAGVAGRPSAFDALEREIVARAGGASQAARLARDLHVLPDFLGNRSPHADPAARGAVVGFDLRDDEESAMALYVAGLCGLAQGLGQVIRLLERNGFACDALVASGGAARSALVRQIVADATGRPVAAPETSEPVLLGGAMLGAVAAGRRTLIEAMTTMSKLGLVSEPAGGEIAALHAAKRRVFEALQEAERTARAAMREGERAAVWPKVIIFDCDGVIVDSETIALERTRAVLARYGLELSAEQARERFLGVSAQAIRRMAERDLGSKLPANFLDELTQDIIAAFEHELKGVEGVREALAELGGGAVCIASSSSLERTRASLRIVGYTPLFEPNLFSAAEVAHGKPAPDLFLHAAKRMGARPVDCLVIEDSEPGVTAAVRAEMTVFGFLGGGHIVGHAHGERLSAAGAAQVFDDMRELPRRIREQRGRRAADGCDRAKGRDDGEKR